MKYIINIFSNVKCLVLISIGVLLLLLLFDKGHWQDSRFRFDQVYPIASTLDGQNSNNSIDYVKDTSDACVDKNCDFTFSLGGQRIDRMFISFDYLEAPDALEIWGDREGKSVLLDRIDRSENLEDLRKYNSSFHYNEAKYGVKPYYLLDVAGSFDQIRLKIFAAKEYRIVTVTDVFFYSKETVSTQRFLLNLFANHKRSVVSYAFYAILFLMITLPPGLFAAEKWFGGKLPKVGIVIVGMAIAIAFWGGIGFLSLIFPPPFGTFLAIIAMLVSLFYLVRGDILTKIKLNSLPVMITLCFSLFMLTYLLIFNGGLKSNELYYLNDVYYDGKPTYDIHPGKYFSDQMVPYGSAKILIYKLEKGSGEYTNLVGDNLLSLRPQLFTYFTIPFLKVFGDKFQVFEILGLILVIFLPASVYLLADTMIKDRRATGLAVYFAFISPYIVYMFHITQVKIICTILITIYFCFLYMYKTDKKKIYLIAASLLASVSILVHNFTFIYIVAGVFYLTPNLFALFKRKNIADILIITVPFAVFAVWLAYSYFDAKASLVTGITETKKSLANLEYFRQKFGTRFETLSPYLIRYLNFIGFFIADPAPMIAYHSESFFRATIYSLSSFVLFPFLIWSLIRYIRQYFAIGLYLLILLLFTIYSEGNYSYAFGLHLYMVAAIPLLIVLATKIIYKLPQRIILIVCTLAIAESFYINFVSQKDLSDLSLYQAQFPFLSLLLFLFFVLLQISPLYYFFGKVKINEN